MSRKLIPGLLVAANLVLVALLASGLAKRGAPKATDSDDHTAAVDPEASSDSPSAVRSASTRRRTAASSNSVPSTPFTQMYSQDGKQFASNLRGIACPEETVKDILVAEVGRRYRAQEEELRPKPADHVPIMWSFNPSERRLFQRWDQAAAIAHEKAALLREALGYEVPVVMPVYAITSSEQRFEHSLATLTPEKRRAAVKAHEDYWAKVHALRERTKGFWQSEDVAELEQLKAERLTLIGNLVGAP